MKANFTNFRFKLLFALIVLLSFSGNVFAQTKHSVDVTNNVYTPANLTINTGDTVVWINKEGFHNVNGTQGTFPNNPESFGNSTSLGWTFSYVFNKSGTYNYQCDPHVSFGMTGKIEVTTATTIEDLTAQINEVLVYPNPAKEKIYLSIKHSENDDLKVQVYSIAGRILKSSTFTYSNSPIEIDISSLKNGVYFMRIESSEVPQIVKFVKN